MVDVSGVLVDLDTIRYTLVFISSLLIVEGIWQMIRRGNERALQTVIEAEKSGRLQAERESQVAQDDVKSVSNRADNAERRIRDLVAQAERAEKELQQELARQRQALQNAEAKLTAIEAKASSQEGSGTASVVALLGLLQEQGRFIDFLMEDITVFPDDRVAGAARFVHAGCSSVIKQYMDLIPIQSGDTGRQVTVEKGMPDRSIRFVGNSAVDFPATGKLLHRGWKATRLVLPKAMAPIEGNEGVVVAPAEIEVVR